MYLSRIQLQDAIFAHSQLGLLLKDRSYGIHRLLWDLFDDKQRFIYREESAAKQTGASRNQPMYYVLSQMQPNMESPIFSVESKLFSPVLHAGDQLSFRLRANPTIARRAEGVKNSKRHDVVIDAQRSFLIAACAERELPTSGSKSQLRKELQAHDDYQDKTGRERLKQELDKVIAAAAFEWLNKRGDSRGYLLNTVQSTGYRWNALPEKGRSAGFSSLDYEGVLTVSEPEIFVKMLGDGLGPSKAFGCGLMMIRRM
ncbi:MAG: type I-E CRISPR-associated protein Cas6/Cse3/CasE [Pseudomonadales bacterium]|nr:type I-E CRISPR-associated protein Cas6/Cse3/CasE [Pseudomonadales bacterium]